MHSSRMRTVRCSGRLGRGGGVSAWRGVCLGGVCLGVYSPRPRGRHLPVNRITDRCKNITFPVADPGFPRGGAPTPKSAIIFQFFSRKLHENERIWAPPGGARSWHPHPFPPWIRQCFPQLLLRTLMRAFCRNFFLFSFRKL